MPIVDPDNIKRKPILDPDEVPVVEQREDPGFIDGLWEKAKDLFDDPAAEKAKATQAMVDSKLFGLRPYEAYKFKDDIDRVTSSDRLAGQSRKELGQMVKDFQDSPEWSKLPGEVAGAAAGMASGTAQYLQAWGASIDAAEDVYRKDFKGILKRKLKNGEITQEGYDQSLEDFNNQIKQRNKSKLNLWSKENILNPTAEKAQKIINYVEEKAGGFAQEQAVDYAGTFLENPSWRRGFSALAQGAGSLAVAIPASIVAGPEAGAILLSAAEAGPVFKEARAKGKSETEAMYYANLVLFGTAILEKVGLDNILKATGGKIARFFRGLVAEAGTEDLQTLWQNGVARHGYDETAGYFDGMIEATIGGFVGGPAAVMFGPKGEKPKPVPLVKTPDEKIEEQEKIDKIPDDKISNTRIIGIEKEDEEGNPLTYTVIDNVSGNTLTVEVGEDPDTVKQKLSDIRGVDPIVEEEINKIIESGGDESVLNETTRLPRIERFYAQAVEVVGEEEADAVVGLLDARAKAVGMTADEYLEYHNIEIEQGGEGGDLAQSKATVTFEENRTIIRAFEQADVSSLAHELAHVFRRDIGGQDLAIAEEWAGVQDGIWDVKAEEKFARGFEKYLAEGKAPNAELENLFKQFKAWLLEIYKTIKGSDIDVQLDPKIQGVFDRLLTEQTEVSNVTLAQAKQEDSLSGVVNRIQEQVPDIKLNAYESDGVITLSKIEIPKDKQGQGVGSGAMSSLIIYADRTGQTIALSPTGDFGGNKKRLVEFYKNLGFTANKGKDKDFSISESMYREPQKNTLAQAAQKKSSKTQQSTKKSIKQLAKQIRQARESKNTQEEWRLKNELRTIVGKHKAEAASYISATITEQEKAESRRKQMRIFRDYFGLSDADLRKISKKDPRYMTEAEFKRFKDEIYLKAAQLAEQTQAKLELVNFINANRLQMVDNFRKALQLPTIDKMSTKQLRDFLELLEPYQPDDVFLSQREIETVDRTDLEGIRTWREARERLAEESGVNIEDLKKVKVNIFDSFRWDTSLMEKNDFYKILVSQMVGSTMSAELQIHNIENEIFRLARASEESKGRSVKRKIIPQDPLIMAYLEAAKSEKSQLAAEMTSEQLELAHYMQEYFTQALGYLVKNNMIGRGRENYFVHIRKTLLEDISDSGLLTAVKSMFKNYQQDQMVFNILDDDTGTILPLEKFFQFSLQRTGNLDPTSNVVKAFLQYANTFEKKKMYDSIIPKLDIYAKSLTPRRYTPRGLEMDRSLIKFVNQYINNKKGRRISYDSMIKQGGPIDMGLNSLRTFISMVDLGFSIPIGIASFVGEQTANFEMLGTKAYLTGNRRAATKKGRRILEKYEAFTGRSFWENFTAPGRELPSRLSDLMFGFFHVSSTTANKQFLLGSLTNEEWASEKISDERLAEMRLEMGRFRVVPESTSLAGSTSLGKAWTQYRTWAIPMTRTLLKDFGTLTKDLKKKSPGEALTSKEAKEIYRFVTLTTGLLVTGSALMGDSNDDDFVSQLTRRVYRESLSLLQSLSPQFLLSSPRMVTWLADLGANLQSLVLLEEYKHKEGLKGVERLKKQFTPRTIRQITEEDK